MKSDPIWKECCMKERGRVLTGVYSHWCNDWDGLTMDETCDEFPCACYPKIREEIILAMGEFDE